ncbi:MAG: 5-formyltetrahydrofolate cyclo-ligase [Spirochaetes bacterium RBG_16_67_19]|nr:MAG: 5-formyltetrahydrofolate cyclo-ligase [Spirochaetes bacterium RBG_16_67_19]
MQELIARKMRLRKDIRCLLDGREESEVITRSRLVQERLFATEWWRRARWVFVYIAMSVEVDTTLIVTRAYREGRQVAIPRIEGEEITFYRYEGRTRGLVPNQFGILEPDPQWLPVEPRELAEGPLLILAPGLAFDRSLRRIGRGKGYYDRFLARARSGPQECLVVGLTLAEQVVEEVPAGPLDQPLDGLVTDRELIGHPAIA